MVFKVVGCVRISVEIFCIKCKEILFVCVRILCIVTFIFGTILRVKCLGDVGGKVILFESLIILVSVNMIDEFLRLFLFL